MKEHARQEFIAGLRSLAAFYESRPGAYYDGIRVTIAMYAAGRRAQQAFAAMAQAFADADREAAAVTAPAAYQRNSASCSGGCCSGAFCSRQAVLARDFSTKVRLELFASGAGRCRCSGESVTRS